jgi:hypothetical protein
MEHPWLILKSTMFFTNQFLVFALRKALAPACHVICSPMANEIHSLTQEISPCQTTKETNSLLPLRYGRSV